MSGPPLTLPSKWKTLAEAAGSLASLARELGVNVRTVRRWAKGETPMRNPNLMAVATLARKYRVECP